MKLIVLSDTHGSYPLALRAIEQMGTANRIIHLGDTMDDARIIETAIGDTLVKVPGNCDAVEEAPRELVEAFCGKKFLLTHGDRYHVKEGLSSLYRQAVAVGADVVLYGHTHVASITMLDGICFVNPGCFEKSGQAGSCAAITIDAGAVSAHIVSVRK